MKVGFLLFIAVFLFHIDSNAQNFSGGCLINTYNPTRLYNSQRNAYYFVVCNGLDPDNEFATPFGTQGALGSCRVNNMNGRTTNYNVAQCPIDDYIPILILALGSMGFFFVKRNFSLS